MTVYQQEMSSLIQISQYESKVQLLQEKLSGLIQDIRKIMSTRYRFSTSNRQHLCIMFTTTKLEFLTKIEVNGANLKTNANVC